MKTYEKNKIVHSIAELKFSSRNGNNKKEKSVHKGALLRAERKPLLNWP